MHYRPLASDSSISEINESLAPLKLARALMFKRLLFSVWAILAFYSILFGILQAKLAFWVVLAGALLFSPLTLWIENKRRHTSARLFFVVCCNLYIYLASLGLGHQVAAEYFFLPAIMIPRLVFDSTKRFEVTLSILISFFFWIATAFFGTSFVPDSLIASHLPFATIKTINFVGAFAISLLFLWAFMKTIFQLKDIIIFQVRREAAKHKAITETMSEGLVIQDKDGKIISHNPSALEILGLTSDQLHGRTSYDPKWKAVRPNGEPFPGSEHPAIVALQTKKPVIGTVMGLNLPNGEKRWIKINAIPTIDNDLHRVTVTFSDISEVVESTQLLKNAQAIAKTGSWTLDLKSNALTWSSEHYRIFEILEPQNPNCLRSLFESRIHHYDIRTIKPLIGRAISLGKDFECNYRLVFENGKRIKHIKQIGKVQKNESGTPISISGTCQDITEMVRIQEENRFTLDSLKIGVWKYNPVNQTLMWDKSMYRLFDIRESDFSGDYNAWESTLTPESKASAIEELTKALKGEKEFDTVFEIQTRSAGRRYISGRAKVIRDNAGNPIMMYGVNMDVTTQKTNELERERVSKLLEVVLKNVPSMIFVKDYKKNLSFSLLNQSGQSLLGLTETQFLNRNDFDFFPKEQAELFRSKDLEVFNNKAVVKIEKEEIDTPFGKRFLETYKVPTFDQNGEPQFLIGISNDITAELKIKADLELERSKSLKNAKLASLGEMSAGIAHEINNPLAIISGSADLLLRVSNNPEKFAAKIQSIKKSCERIARIVTGLRKFSRSAGKANFATHDLCDIVKETLVLTDAKSQRHSTPVTFECITHQPVFCDEIEIEQVLINLINNAIDAVKFEEQKWVKVSLFEEGENIILRITDSGRGIPEEIRNKLYDPFFTTKKVGEGTGLGLSIVKGILDEHKATITVVSDSPNTCFEIRFLKEEVKSNAA